MYPLAQLQHIARFGLTDSLLKLSYTASAMSEMSKKRTTPLSSLDDMKGVVLGLVTKP